MTSYKLNTAELFSSLDKTFFELLSLVTSLNEKALNEIPSQKSWTAAQLATHITKSNSSINQALKMDAQPTERNADERVEELKKIFLNYTIKFQSPEFIVPPPGFYEKERVVVKLKRSNDLLRKSATETNLSEIISLPVFGEITKLELLHFVLYHTQRHIYQLKKIIKALEKKANTYTKKF
jgi:hypothetical protein